MIGYANCLLDNPIGACGGSFTGQNGSATNAASPLRAEQERVKNAIDKINSGGSFVQPAPCSVVTTAETDQHDRGEENEKTVARSSTPMPTAFEMSQNYPNPFNPTTVISFQLPVSGYAAMKVYNVLGQEVATLVDGIQDAGYKSAGFNASHLASGVYFYRLTASSGFSSIKSMLLVK
jgi:hypothetical protein